MFVIYLHIFSRKYHIVGTCFKVKNPACDVTAPKIRSLTEEGEAEASVFIGPALSENQH